MPLYVRTQHGVKNIAMKKKKFEFGLLIVSKKTVFMEVK